MSTVFVWTRYLQNPKCRPKKPQPLKQIIPNRNKPQRLRYGLLGALTGARLGDVGDAAEGALGAATGYATGKTAGATGDAAGSVAAGALGAAADGVATTGALTGDAVRTVGAARGATGAAKGDTTGATGVPTGAGWTATGARTGEFTGTTAGAAAGATAGATGAAAGADRATGDFVGANGDFVGVTGDFVGADGDFVGATGDFVGTIGDFEGATGTGVQTKPEVFFVRRVIAFGSVYTHISPVAGENEMPSGFRATPENGKSKVDTMVPSSLLCIMRSLSSDRTNSVFDCGSYVIPARSVTFDVQEGRLSTSIRMLNTPVATSTDQIRRGFFSVRTYSFPLAASHATSSIPSLGTELV
jgi:hypothetical protein